MAVSACSPSPHLTPSKLPVLPEKRDSTAAAVLAALQFPAVIRTMKEQRRFAHMKNARIIAVLALLALSLSGCANTDRFVVSAPPSQETVTTEPAQNNVPREQGTVPVSESTEIPAESTEPTEIVEPKRRKRSRRFQYLPKRKRRRPSTFPRKLPRRKHPNPNHRKNLRKHSRRSLNRPSQKNPQSRYLTFRLGSTMPMPMPKAWDCGWKVRRWIAGIIL